LIMPIYNAALYNFGRITRKPQPVVEAKAPEPSIQDTHKPEYSLQA